MGRDWYLGGSGRSTKRSRDTSSSTTTTTPPGCMNAVFHFFDFHHFQLCLNQNHQHQQPTFQPHEDDEEDHPIVLKGVEAPRNSLESEKILMADTSFPLTIENERNLHIPMGIQIKTSMNDASSSESSYSPSIKTPNLVARLMGLDLLPDGNSPLPSPSSSSSSNHLLRKSHLHQQSNRTTTRHQRNCSDLNTGSRSLPETPRISSARKSDADYHHRLSLQLKKVVVENDENRSSNSPSHYAKQIAKQVRESVSRRVGLDNISNTWRTRSSSSSSDQDRRDENLLGIKPKNSTTPPPSSRTSTLDNESSHLPKKTTKSQPLQQQQKSIQKTDKVTGERFRSRIKKPVQNSVPIRNKKEDSFVRPSTASRAHSSDYKKCKKTPLLSNDLLPVKKDPSPPATKLPSKQVPNCVQGSKLVSQLSSNSCPTFKQEAMHAPTTREPTFGGRAEFQYVTKILQRTGIGKDTLISFTKWFSPSHPLDPSIFYHLEFIFPITLAAITVGADRYSQLSHRCNRKLIFNLVDEILVDILKPFINMKPWISKLHHGQKNMMRGSQLIEKLCGRIRSFPMAKCEDLQDIDALIEQDLDEKKKASSSFSSTISTSTSIEFEEEGESIVWDIEKDIMDSLVDETVAFCVRTVTVSDSSHMGLSRDEML